jgi:hypothetical protein
MVKNDSAWIPAFAGMTRGEAVAFSVYDTRLLDHPNPAKPSAISRIGLLPGLPAHGLSDSAARFETYTVLINAPLRARCAPLLSFPRKRESMLTLNGQMDSRFRGNEGLA